MEISKIHLSADELLLIRNEEWILTKNGLIEKLIAGMGQLSIRMQQQVAERKHRLIEELLPSNPKISRGEKYQGLPYIILDYPRIFEKENILAIRTFFWWGNFCSITLHVSGKYHALIAKNLAGNYHLLQEKKFYLSTSGNEWNHDLSSSDYQPLTAGAVHASVPEMSKGNFLKLGAKVEFSQWNEMEAEIYSHFLVLLKLTEF